MVTIQTMIIVAGFCMILSFIFGWILSAIMAHRYYDGVIRKLLYRIREMNGK
jgi:ABC-type dipeptide/oligopeptide/nickel transport system permease subunit